MIRLAALAIAVGLAGCAGAPITVRCLHPGN